jgi:hypothetical protein
MDTHPNAYAYLMTLVHNTRSNIFLQSMKTNPLSVKKLMKNLILRTLRQLYAVSEIIIVLIWWVTPPPLFDFLQFEFFVIFNFVNLFEFVIWGYSSLPLTLSYIYIYLSFSCPLQHSHIAKSSICIFIYVNVIGPAPLCAILKPVRSQILHVRSNWNCSKSPLCPWQLKNLRTNL